MKEIKFPLPAGAENVSLKIEDGCAVVTYEPEMVKFGDCVVWDNEIGTIIYGIIVGKDNDNKDCFSLFNPFEKGDEFKRNSCWTGYMRFATDSEKCKILEETKSNGFIIDYDKKEIVKKRWRAYCESGYYYINSVNKIETENEYGDDVDDDRYEIGNYFRTKEQSEKVAKEIKEVFEKHKND